MTAEDVKVGPFQVVLLHLLGYVYMIVAMSHALPTFHNYTPPFFCESPLCMTIYVPLDLVPDATNKTYDCVGSPAPFANLTGPSGSVDSTCLAGYRFETDYGETSIITEWGLVCEKRYLSALSTTLYFLGVVLGALVSGPCIDRWGRLPMLGICLYIQGAMAVSLYIVQSYAVFLAIRCLQGVFVQGLQNSTYTLILELFPATSRSFVGIFVQSTWAVGLLVLAALSYCIPDWRILQLAISVPTASTVFFVWILPESPRWLLAKGKLTEADIALEKIAKYNECCGFTGNSSTSDASEADATLNELVPPEKPERKSRTKETRKVRTNDTAPEEAANLLTTADDGAPKISFVAIAENLERRLTSVPTPGELHRDSEIIGESGKTRRSLPPKLRDSRTNPRSTGAEEAPLNDAEEAGRTEETETGVASGETRSEGAKGAVDVEDEKPEEKCKQGFLDCMRHRLIRKYSFIMVFECFSVSLAYYVIMFLLPNLSGNRHATFVMGAGLELVSYVITYFVLVRYGRRKPMCVFLLFNGVVCTVVTAFALLPEDTATTWIGPAKTALILLGKAAVVSCFAIVFLYSIEIFPTVVRGACLGLCTISARTGSLVSSPILLLGDYTSHAVPIALMGILCLAAGVATLKLPETLNEPLPDTIQDVERLGRNKRRNADRSG